MCNLELVLSILKLFKETSIPSGLIISVCNLIHSVAVQGKVMLNIK